MIDQDLLAGIDYAFAAVVIIFAIFTPKKSDYEKLNWLIVALFLINIGVAEVALDRGIGRSVLTCSLNAFVGGLFAYWFWPSSKKQLQLINSPLGQYVSFLCGSLALFHIVDIFYSFSELSYSVAMVCFQVLLLMAASWGVVDGNHDRFNRWCRSCYSWFGSRFRGHWGNQ